MADIAQLQMRVESLEVQQAQQRLSSLTRASAKAERSVGGVTRSSNQASGGMRSMSRSAAGMIAKIGGITALGVAVSKLSQAGIRAAASFERQEKQLEIMLGSAGAASDMFSDLQEFTATTPLQLEQVTQSAQQLLSFGTEDTELLDQLRMIGDLALGDANKMQSLVRAFGRVQARGRASMEEINIVMESGVPIIDRLAEEFGVANDAVFEMASDGEISADRFQAAMASMTAEGGMFNEGMEELSTTFEGKLSTAMDNIKLLGGTMFEPMMEASKDTLDGIIAITNQLREMFDVAGRTAGDLASGRDNEIAQLIESADSYEELDSRVRGLSESMFEAAHETGNFVAAAEQIQELSRVNQQIRQMERDASETTEGLGGLQDQLDSIFGGGDDLYGANLPDSGNTRSIEDQAEVIQDLAGQMGEAMSSVQAQGLAEQGEQAVREWFENTAQELEETSPELQRLIEERDRILSGRAITPTPEEGDQGGGGSPYDTSFADFLEELFEQAAPAEVKLEELNDQLSRVEANLRASETAQSGYSDEQVRQLEIIQDYLEEEIRNTRELGNERDDTAQKIIRDLERQIALRDANTEANVRYELSNANVTESEREQALALARRVDAMEREEELMQRAEEVRSSLMTAEEEYTQQAREMWELVEAGVLGMDQYTEAVANLREELIATKADGSAFVEELERIAQSAAWNAIETGVDSFGDLGQSIIESEDAMAGAQQVAKEFAFALLDMMPGVLLSIAKSAADDGNWALALGLVAAAAGTSVSTGIMKGIDEQENAQGNVYDSGGMVPFAQGGVVTRPTTFPFKNGVGLMGEAGPEAIMPLQRTASGDLGVRSSGGGGGDNNVNVSVHNYSGEKVERRERQSGNAREIELIIGQNVDRHMASGRGDGAMKSNFGMKRKPR